MVAHGVRFKSFPLTELPPVFIENVIGAFRVHEEDIACEKLGDDTLCSNEVLAVLRPELVRLGFSVEASKNSEGRISCSLGMLPCCAASSYRFSAVNSWRNRSSAVNSASISPSERLVSALMSS